MNVMIPCCRECLEDLPNNQVVCDPCIEQLMESLGDDCCVSCGNDLGQGEPYEYGLCFDCFEDMTAP